MPLHAVSGSVRAGTEGYEVVSVMDARGHGRDGDAAAEIGLGGR